MATCQYQILLLLTDGEIHDMPETKQLIAAMSNLPCSIIIVGVGDERFLGMQALDGDDDSPPEMRRYRDLVQFVPNKRLPNWQSHSMNAWREVTLLRRFLKKFPVNSAITWSVLESYQLQLNKTCKCETRLKQVSY